MWTGLELMLEFSPLLSLSALSTSLGHKQRTLNEAFFGSILGGGQGYFSSQQMSHALPERVIQSCRLWTSHFFPFFPSLKLESAMLQESWLNEVLLALLVLNLLLSTALVVFFMFPVAAVTKTGRTRNVGTYREIEERECKRRVSDLIER